MQEGGMELKQHISTSDLQQLTPSQQEKLRELWQSRINDVFTTSDPTMLVQSDEFIIENIDSHGAIYDWRYGVGFLKKDCLPLLSIGQMLDILHARNSQFGNHYIDFDWEGELIDALWNEVKSIL